MFGIKWFKICLITGILTVFLWTPTLAASEVFVHFVVVPSKTTVGRAINKALDDLKLFFAKTAGGYTYLGPTEGGFLPPGGSFGQNANNSFLVAAPRDITEAIEAYVPKYFETKKPYILVWKAVSNY